MNVLQSWFFLAFATLIIWVLITPVTLLDSASFDAVTPNLASVYANQPGGASVAACFTALMFLLHIYFYFRPTIIVVFTLMVISTNRFWHSLLPILRETLALQSQSIHTKTTLLVVTVATVLIFQQDGHV